MDAFVDRRESDVEVAARLRPRLEADLDWEELELEDADDDEDEDEETFTGGRRWQGEESMTLFALDGTSLETAGGEAGIEGVTRACRSLAELVHSYGLNDYQSSP